MRKLNKFIVFKFFLMILYNKIVFLEITNEFIK
jgi:hypothetical protein